MIYSYNNAQELSEDEMKSFIQKRLSNMLITVNFEGYKELLKEYLKFVKSENEEILIEKNINVDRLLKDKTQNLEQFVNIINEEILPLLNGDMLFDLYSTCNEINQVEQNFFILWHLFGFARKLLRLFISSSNHINFYDNLLSEKGENEGKEEHEYLDENIYLEIRNGNNKTAIPHQREKLLNIITQYCIGLINQQSSGHQGETSGGNFGDTSGSGQ
uniref:Uncharacterized protein n=1 Tax=Meloidogyne floridensis TaxID=298350 RepID=A0A915NIA0_9BILA